MIYRPVPVVLITHYGSRGPAPWVPSCRVAASSINAAEVTTVFLSPGYLGNNGDRGGVKVMARLEQCAMRWDECSTVMCFLFVSALVWWYIIILSLWIPYIYIYNNTLLFLLLKYEQTYHYWDLCRMMIWVMIHDAPQNPVPDLQESLMIQQSSFMMMK